MTERKIEYITDALGEISDEFVAEAVEYKKAKFTWKYTKELVTMAACVAVLFISVNAVRMIPIGGSNETAAGAPSVMQEAATPESVVEEMAPAPMNGNIENLSRPVGAEDVQKEYFSKEIEWEEVIIAEDEQGKDICEYPTQESLQTSSCLKWMSAEEILALDVDIFMGTVTNMQTYHVSGGMTKYFTVATVEVEDSIRGGLAISDTCRIYLPFAEVDSLKTTTSIIGDLDKLEVGSRAIFMPYKTTEETGEGNDEVWLSYRDFSEYYFGEGMRFLFLETESGTSYAVDVYEISGGNAASLEEIAEYLREKISE